MFKKIVCLNVKDVIFNRSYWWQVFVCLFIGNTTFLNYGLDNENLLLAKLFSSYATIFIFSLSLNIVEIAAVEKLTSRLEFYLANGVSPKKICWCYSISSFILGFVTTILLCLCHFLRIYKLGNASFYNLFMSQNWILLLSAILVCFSASLILNSIAFFIKNSLVMRGFSVLSFMMLFFLSQFLVSFLGKSNFSCMQFLSGLFLFSLCLSIILLVVFFIIFANLKNEKIVLSKI